MDFAQVIKDRYSCKKYDGKPVTAEQLSSILEAGRLAPTAKNLQEQHIYVVQSAEGLAKIDKLTPCRYGAPTVLVVLDDKTNPNGVQDASLVMGNLMNAAHALGLGSCWINRARETFQLPEGKALLEKWGVPQRYEGLGNCILGYAAQEAPAPKPRKADYVLRV